MHFPDSPLIIIVGPTAVGKTEVSIQLAHHFDGEIISADSRLFYRGMDIGTAKPTVFERGGINHHLIDISDPDEVLSLVTFQEKACIALKKIWENQHIPFLVGGTGQYIRSVTEGWIIPPKNPDENMRYVIEKIAKEIGGNELHRRLSIIDPDAARIIEPGNIRRTVRALEVIFSTGIRYSLHRRRSHPPYSMLQIGLIRPRSELYARIDDRIENMIKSGFIEEVKALLQKGYSPVLPAFSAIGYREIISHLQGEITLDEAVSRMKKITRQFVRRQSNWFKQSDATIKWFWMSEKVVDEICTYIESGNGWLLANKKN